jgi:hypothetical protein
VETTNKIETLKKNHIQIYQKILKINNKLEVLMQNGTGIFYFYFYLGIFIHNL